MWYQNKLWHLNYTERPIIIAISSYKVIIEAFKLHKGQHNFRFIAHQCTWSFPTLVQASGIMHFGNQILERLGNDYKWYPFRDFCNKKVLTALNAQILHSCESCWQFGHFGRKVDKKRLDNTCYCRELPSSSHKIKGCRVIEGHR